MHQADPATNQAAEAGDFKDHTARKANNTIQCKIDYQPDIIQLSVNGTGVPRRQEGYGVILPYYGQGS